MNKLNKVVISLSCLLCFVGCDLFNTNTDGLNAYRELGQVVDVDYEALSTKIMNDETFVFFLKQDNCASCAKFYPIVSEFLDENPEEKIHVLNYSKMQPVDAVTLAANYLEVLGNSYYNKNDYSSTSLYTPSICKVVNGEIVDAKIGVVDKDQIKYMYQENYISMDYYYSLNRKIQKKDTFNVFVSKKGDAEYDSLLREYFVSNANLSGYYLNSNHFEDSENERLLSRVNYYLGEGNEIETLPDYYLLQYEKGVLKNYVAAKYDVSSLDALYK